ncbi:MAG: pitrilysin family protein [Myxococcaceae bacterium]
MASRFRLPNGLTVVLEENHAAPVAAFQLWVKVGSADEAPDEVGLAHLHEHMLFKGTKRRGPGEIARSVEAHGGEINAWTSFDQTVYHVVMASRFAREGLDVLADAIRNSAFDPDELSREIEVVCEEIKRSHDMPSRRASKELFSASFRAHPYGRPVIGFEADVRSHTRERVLNFYAKHYTPSNIVLSAVGDVTEAQVREWANELLGGDWSRPAQPRRERPLEPAFDGVRVGLLTDDVKESWLHLAFQTPGVDHADAPALDVLAMLVGQGDSSRLSLEVKRKRSLVKDVNAWSWTPKEPGLFAASLVVSTPQVEAAFEATAQVLATMTATEVAQDELDTVKSLIEADAVYQRETVQGVARKLGSYESTMGGIEREAQYYEAISQVTTAKVREVAQRYLTFDRATVTGLLPKGTAFDEAIAKAVLARVAKERPAPLPARNLAASKPLRTVGSSRKEKPGVTVEKLPSGATLIVREERSVPLFSMRAAFQGGVRYETEATNGITSLLARTLTRGTASYEAEQISHLVDSLAGSLNAMGGRSSMSVRGEFLSKHFERGFDLFAEVMNRPSFPEAEVARERHLQLQDIAAREDRPSSVAFELFSKTLFTKHPYRLSLSGEKASVESLTPAMLKDFHATWFDPSRLTLAVVGDVDTQAVLEAATKAFGQSRGNPVAPSVPVEPMVEAPRQVKRTLAKAQTQLVLGFPGARVTDDWRRPLEVLSTLLSGQSGRLFIELRDKRSMAYSVSSTTLEGVDPGYFAVYMATSPEKVDAALAGMREELQKLKDVRVGDDELLRARRYLVGTQQIGLQRNGARAATMALDACYGLGPEKYVRYADEMESVTADDVLEVARRVLDFGKETLVTVGP